MTGNHLTSAGLSLMPAQGIALEAEAASTKLASRRWVPGATVCVWYLLGAIALDVQLPAIGVNLGNLFLLSGALISAALAIHGRVLFREQGIGLQLHDFVYIGYLGFALASASWSPSPTSTVVQVVFLAGTWLAAFSLSHTDIRIVLRMVILAAVVTALLSFALVPVSRELAFQPATSTALPELRGVFAHQLRLGLFMSIALGLIVVGALNRELRALVGSPAIVSAVVLVLLACLLAAFARLYTAAMLIALVATVGLARPGWRRTGSLAVVGVIVAVCWLQRDALLQWIAATGTDITLTGRTVMWAKTLSLPASNPWLGFGYSSFDQQSFDWLWGYYRPAHPHNSYIHAFFETGYIGLGLTLLLVATHLRTAFKAAGRCGRRFPYSLYLLLLTMVGSLTGSNYAGKPSLLFCLMLLVLSIEARSVKGTALRSQYAH